MSNLIFALIVVPFIVSVIANLLTPRFKDWIATQSVLRREKRIKELTAEMEFIQSLRIDTHGAIFVVAQPIIRAFIALITSVGLYIYSQTISVSTEFKPVLIAISAGYLLGVGPLSLFQAARYIENITLQNNYKEKMLARIDKLCLKP